MSLQVADRLYVLTPAGEREIQLCLGDITKLSAKDQVDVLLISAFPGDYSAVRTSVIGALLYNLKINVRELSMNKKEDLRHKFHCWISQRLAPDLPYKQIICAEKDEKGTPIKDVVKNMFRALMPVFNTENKKVITSLLGTGSQNSTRKEVLEVMVNTAVGWMHMGLPLELLKIVVYSKDPSVLTKDDKECLHAFKWLRKKHEKGSGRIADPTIKDDIFLVTSANDEALTDTVKKELKVCQKSIKIVTPGKVAGKEETWQHDMYIAMTTCARVVPVLTEAFLDDEQCVDLYNIAMCCNRQLQRNLLTPICTERLEQLPIYMAMVQWYYCRDGDLGKIKNACENLVEQVKVATAHKQIQYDVFISYSHKNTEIATKMLSQLRETKKNLNIFFDYEELKTGMAWQQSLYTSIENSACVIALLSPDYMKSAVCTEEFNIAMARYLTKKHKVKLLPVCIQKVEDFAYKDKVEVHYAKNGDIESLIMDICQKAVNKKDYPPKEKESKHMLENLWKQHRQNIFHHFYTYSDNEFKLKNQDSESPKRNPLNIKCSFTARDHKYFKLIKLFLNNKLSDVKLSLNPLSQIDQEKSPFFLVGLSSTYFQSKSQIEELNWILSELRQGSGRVMVYAVWLDQSQCPMYAKLIPAATSVTDPMWEEAVGKEEIKVQELPKEFISSKKSVEAEYGAFQESEVIAVLKCVCDLTSLVSGRDIPGTPKGRGVLLSPLPCHNTMNVTLPNPQSSSSKGTIKTDQNTTNQMQNLKIDDGTHDSVVDTETTGNCESKKNSIHGRNSNARSANCVIL